MPITINGSGTVTGITAGGLPDAIITQPELATGVASTGPAFSAYASVAQTVTNSTFTKVTLGVEDFDTNSNFASSTFTPTVAGYYQFNCGIYTNCTLSQTRILLSIYKNGSAVSRLIDNSVTYAAGQDVIVQGSILIYANGTTDYFEMYGFLTGTGTLTFSTSGSAITSRFSASLVRSA